MPPKPKPPPAAPAAPPPLDPEAELERRFLIEQCKTLKAQRILEEAQLAQFHEEKERLRQLWVSCKKDLEDMKATFRAKEKDRDDLAEAHIVEIKVYKQRIKHMLFEHQNEATEARTDTHVALKMAQETHRGSEAELRSDRRDLKAVLREMETAHEDFLKALKLEQDRAITDLRIEFERDTRELQMVYEDRMVRTRDELNKAREDEIRAIEKRKSKHIAALVASHEKAFADIKRFYNEITHSNLDLIKTLKDEVEELRSKEAMHERSMFAIAQDNKKMSEPMRRAIEEVKRLRDERIAYQRDLEELAETKAHILVTQDKAENLRWEHEIVEQRYMRLAAERDALFERFQAALHDVKQKTGFKTLLLEKRITATAAEAERTTIALSEVLAAAHLDSAVVGHLEAQIGDVIGAKDAAIAELETELARVAAKHDAVVDAYLTKMDGAGVPREELGFMPMRSTDILATSAAATTSTLAARTARTVGPAAAATVVAAAGGFALAAAAGGSAVGMMASTGTFVGVGGSTALPSMMVGGVGGSVRPADASGGTGRLVKGITATSRLGALAATGGAGTAGAGVAAGIGRR